MHGRGRGARRAIGLLIVAGALMGAAMGPGAGHASGAVSCSGVPFAQPFLPWLDPASYFLAPDGGFERGGAGWTLTGGAKIARGNETFSVNAAADARSLVLPAGSSATSPATCITADSPTLRLFALNSGSALSTLDVELVLTDPLLGIRAVPVGSVVAGSTWSPTPVIPLAVNLTALPVASDGTVSAKLRFTPAGLFAADWRIDDVYVDPFKGS